MLSEIVSRWQDYVAASDAIRSVKCGISKMSALTCSRFYRKIVMRLISLTLVALSLATSAIAQIPDGYCTVVLSSRPTLAQAAEDVRARWSDRDTTVYLLSLIHI